MDGDGRELKPSSSWNNSSSSSTSYQSEEETVDLRRGPWTVEEDLTLINYIASHGEGRWNSLARCAGLKRTGKSCRLRWLNYLRPDVRRGNITLEEQLMILELHSRWGNRWSKIAQHLPGRTDNEIKNYWRTRVQKHAKQLKCDVNSKQFKDAMRYLWMPRLLERIQSSSATSTAAAEHFGVGLNMTPSNYSTSDNLNVGAAGLLLPAIGFQSPPYQITNNYMIHTTTESSSAAAVSSDSLVTPSDLTSDDNIIGAGVNYNFNDTDYFRGGYADSLIGFPAAEQSSQGPWLPDSGSDISKNVLNVEDVWFFSSRSN